MSNAAAVQDFETYQGDAALPIFMVVDQSGAPINISTVSQILWSAQRSLTAAPVLTKTKTGGGIAFVTDGTDGRFQVTITNADTSSLSGFYLHQAQIIDGSGNQTTVTTGRFQVGRAPSWSYDPGSLPTQQVYGVRFFIGDTDTTDQQLTDEEIAWALTFRGNIYGATAMCALALAAKYSRLTSISIDGTSQALNQRAQQYTALSNTFQKKETLRSAVPSLYGVSISDMLATLANSDRVPDIFRIGLMDNPISDGVQPYNQPPSGADAASDPIDGFLV